MKEHPSHSFSAALLILDKLNYLDRSLFVAAGVSACMRAFLCVIFIHIVSVVFDCLAILGVEAKEISYLGVQNFP